MRKTLAVLLMLIPSFAMAGIHIMQNDPITASSVTITGAGVKFADGTVQVTSATAGGGSGTNPMSDFGDMIYGGDLGTETRLPGNTAAVQKFLSMTGDGVSPSTPTWAQVPVSGLLTYFFSSQSSDIASYSFMIPISSYTPASTSTNTVTANTTGVIIATFTTGVGLPGITFIPDGIVHVHIHTQKAAGANNYVAYCKIYKRNTGGVETLLTTSETSQPKSANTEIEQNLTAVIGPNGVFLDASDRIVIVLYVQMLSATASVSTYYGGDTDSRLELPTAALDVTNYLPTSTLTNPILLSSAVYVGPNHVTPANPSAIYFNRLEETVISNLDAGNGYSKSAAGTMSQDSTDFIRSTQSLSLTSDGASTAVVAKKLSISPTIDFTGKQVVLYLKVSTMSIMSEGSLYLSDSNLASSFYIFDWAAATGGQAYKFFSDGEWVRIVLDFGEASVTGSPARNAINSIQLRIKDNSTGQVNVHWNGIASIPEPPKGIVSLTFDDSYASQNSTAAAFMDKYGFRGTAFTIPANIGHSTTFLTTATLRNLETGHGWEIGAHYQTDLTSLSTTSVNSALFDTKNYLVANGYSRYMDGFAYPNGAFNSSVMNEARKFFTYGRTVIVGPSNTTPYLETIPPADPYKLRAIVVSSATTNNQMWSWVNRAATNKEWLILIFHDIVTLPSSITDVNYSTFSILIDTIAASNVSVRPVGEVLRTIPVVEQLTATDFVTFKSTFQVQSVAKKIDFSSNTVTFSAYQNGNSGASQTIDWKKGNKQTSTLTGSVTYTFMPPDNACNLVLDINTGAGSFTAAWPGTVKWPSGFTPNISTDPSKHDILTFYYDGSGTYYGSYIQNY